MKVGSSNDPEAVKAQYTSSKGLDTRIAFHSKYSTNRQGYGSWIVSNYDIRKGIDVLEAGCGNGSLWLGHGKLIDKCSRLVLADLSTGMLEAAKENLGDKANPEHYLLPQCCKLSYKGCIKEIFRES
ncbi:MAG: class I SAM-dependent methyltransferase [Erysipelotrichaceae bacterium]|nr:class I SAM-dependent methyltransferase [Erysipelotrichaceae bacterium]